ncbi:hypothetical protein QJS10_CPB20g00986 [Acorus calamus]|uniref:Uncharacterized protein n=1 Tax=Acorus calamus TaxID=4465 RepID=A0AAV9CDF8_ACOCL|nr:hypothetical protein QJS10_CPB20g00986 [Acorus calamus]
METKSKAVAQSGSSMSGNSSTGSTSPPEAVSLENAMPKMPRKAVTMKIDVRTLLSTGLLEGFTVKYVFQKHQVCERIPTISPLFAKRSFLGLSMALGTVAAVLNANSIDSSKLDFVPGSKKQDLLANEMHGLHMGEGLISESQEMAENISCGKSVADVTLPDLNHLVQQECSIDKQMPKQSTKKLPPVHYTQILNEMAFRMTTEQLFAIQKSRTRNTEDLHQLVFGERGLPDNTPVGYRVEKNKIFMPSLEQMSPEDFEAHVLGTRLQPSLA